MNNKVLLKVESKGKNKETGEKLTSVRYNEVGWFATPTEPIVVKKEDYEKFCKEGCKNFGTNAGCPPFAPNFEHLKKTYRNAVVVWVRMPWHQMPESFIGNEKFNSNYFYAASYAQAVLPPVVKHLYKAHELFKADFKLGESACKLCNVCAFKVDLPVEEKKRTIKCRHPKDRMFSLESTGIDTDLLMRSQAFPLFWYGRGNKITDIPYTCKMIMFLYKGSIPDIDFTNLLEEILNIQNNFHATSFDKLLGGEYAND